MSGKVQTNAHPEAHLPHGEHSIIPHPPPDDLHAYDKEASKAVPFPDTGWRGDPKIPSQEGGDSEKDFLNKPPYTWKSEGDLFKAKYTTCVPSLIFVKSR